MFGNYWAFFKTQRILCDFYELIHDSWIFLCIIQPNIKMKIMNLSQVFTGRE